MPRKTAPEAQLNEERARVGDNHDIQSPESRKLLRSLSERIMNLLDQRDAVNDDIKVVFKEVSDAGFHGPTLRKAIAKRRKLDKDAGAYNAEQEQIELYFATVWQPDLPFEPETPIVRLAAAGLE